MTVTETTFQEPSWLRLGFFLGVLLLCAIWENKLPRKTLTASRRFRWVNNLSLVAFNSLVIALIMPIAAFQAAVIAQEQQWGLLNILSLPLG